MSQANPIMPDVLRRDAQALAAGFPELLAHARQLAATISLGNHGRRRAGPGDEFWQYRLAMSGDHLREIDWRRSARSDSHFVRQMEWQNLQSVHLWIDGSSAMNYSSSDRLETKGARARVLGLASAILLAKAGESVGLMDDPEPPRHGQGQITKIALHLASAENDSEYGKPPAKHMARGNRALFISDFLGEWDELVETLSRAADQKVEGCLVQVLDPSEEEFPFDGRVIFQSMGGGVQFETRRAKAIRDGYLAKLKERKLALNALASRTGWRYTCHHTSEPSQTALMWIHNALAGSDR